MEINGQVRIIALLAFVIGLLMAIPVGAGEIRIGESQVINGLRLSPVYLHAVSTDPDGGSWGPPPEQADIHLEVDVIATRGNRYGFKDGAFVPALTIHYTLTHLGTGVIQDGDLWAMVANDGPHYGINVKMSGPGRYRLVLFVQPPDRAGFGRHTDAETGVPSWWEPFTVHWDFTYSGKAAKR